jgi:tRNA pseudouridine38-40 synthase
MTTGAMPAGVLLTVAYDGRPFCGFARQPTARTVAGELLGAVRALDPAVVDLRGTSRTDSGVHAHGQLVAFDSNTGIPPKGWALGLARHLPAEIAVVRAATVEPGFEPRRHVKLKTYRFAVLASRVRDPFLEGRVWRLSERLNQMAMAEAAAPLIGEHDFAAFRASGDQRTETVRRIVRVEVRRARSDQRIWEFIVQGDRFLYKMVRIIVGTLVDVGRGRLAANATARALESLSRSDLGITAPPEGLYLDSIELDVIPADSWPVDGDDLSP